MASFRTGTVSAVIEAFADLERLMVHLDDGSDVVAVSFPNMAGTVADGNRVIVNTTGIDLDLGTGGEAFVLWNLDRESAIDLGPGHIVKMRYTPWQMEVLSAEAPESPHHSALKDVTSIEGTPVVACSLHSQIAGVAAGIKAADPRARVGYLMTDGAALPIAWSNLVRELRKAELVDSTATSGHAFGGDLEAVNVFSGLAALKAVAKMDAIVVAMGPGVVGTGTALGFTGMEQGHVLDAAASLEGRPLACLRMSWADDRPRHRGISHHALTALTIGMQGRCDVVIPELDSDKAGLVASQLESSGIQNRHNLIARSGADGIALLRDRKLLPDSMGRPFDEILELHLAAAAAGCVAGGG